jgi:hypothetical protein
MQCAVADITGCLHACVCALPAIFVYKLHVHRMHLPQPPEARHISSGPTCAVMHDEAMRSCPWPWLLPGLCSLQWWISLAVTGVGGGIVIVGAHVPARMLVLCIAGIRLHQCSSHPRLLDAFGQEQLLDPVS